MRVADALDMEHGRARVAFETRLPNIHSLSAAAIDDVRIMPGKQRTIRVEIDMNNSAGVFQVDECSRASCAGPGSRTTSRSSRRSRRSTRSGCSPCTASESRYGGPTDVNVRTPGKRKPSASVPRAALSAASASGVVVARAAQVRSRTA